MLLARGVLLFALEVHYGDEDRNRLEQEFITGRIPQQLIPIKLLRMSSWVADGTESFRIAIAPLCTIASAANNVAHRKMAIHPLIIVAYRPLQDAVLSLGHLQPIAVIMDIH